MSKILDGKALGLRVAEKLKKKINGLRIEPKLIIIQIGDLPESNTYIRNKKLFGEKIGAIVIHKKYSNKVRESEIISQISKYNKDKSIHGIMVQLPAPKGFDIEKVLETIDPKKDVDGLTAVNTKHLFDNHPAFVPATAKGILDLLEKYKVSLVGKKVVIVGESSLVGRPAMLAFLNKGATVTMCHKNTKNLEKETRLADILVTAVGKINLITRKHVNKNQIVVDIGINILKDKSGKKKIIGDVDFKNVSKIVKAITPVPGGVGPMTVASLFQNLLKAAS